MPTKQQLEDASREAKRSPTVWFAVLERALRSKDYELAVQAKQELEALGVEVKFTPKREKELSRAR